VQVLLQPRVLSGRNVVYSAPTSGGKSLVAEILALRRMVNTQKAILLVLPFVALCNEKASHWEKLLSPLGKSVARYYGGQGRVLPKLPEKTGIAVCTIEKANAIVNAMTEAGTLASSFSSVVVDELHMVHDEDRGYLLELLLTKLRFAVPSADPGPDHSGRRPSSAGSGRSVRLGSAGANGTPLPSTQPGSMVTQQGWVEFQGSALPTASSQPPGIQLIGMSATLPNVDLIGKWLDAAVYITDFRPVRSCQLNLPYLIRLASF
jgi:DNA polymerase theta